MVRHTMETVPIELDGSGPDANGLSFVFEVAILDDCYGHRLICCSFQITPRGQNMEIVLRRHVCLNKLIRRDIDNSCHISRDSLV
jgi:hypothetical protein